MNLRAGTGSARGTLKPRHPAAHPPRTFWPVFDGFPAHFCRRGVLFFFALIHRIFNAIHLEIIFFRFRRFGRDDPAADCGYRGGCPGHRGGRALPALLRPAAKLRDMRRQAGESHAQLFQEHQPVARVVQIEPDFIQTQRGVRIDDDRLLRFASSSAIGARFLF